MSNKEVVRFIRKFKKYIKFRTSKKINPKKMLKYGTKQLENQMEKIKRKTKLSKKKKKGSLIKI